MSGCEMYVNQTKAGILLLPPPQPPRLLRVFDQALPPAAAVAGLPEAWLVIDGADADDDDEDEEEPPRTGGLEARPQLALVPVVDHEQPFVMFWYPVHPQIPIKNHFWYY